MEEFAGEFEDRPAVIDSFQHFRTFRLRSDRNDTL